MFIYNLPYGVRSDLVSLLNQGDAWRELAGRRMGYDQTQLENIQRALYQPGTSPADHLLTHWGQRNHTVEELFKHLHAMQLFQAMYVLRECVPDKLKRYLQQPAAMVTTAPAKDTSSSSSTLTGPGLLGRAPPPPLPASRQQRHLLANLNLDDDDDDSDQAAVAAKLTVDDPREVTRGQEMGIKRVAAAAAAPTAAAPIAVPVDQLNRPVSGAAAATAAASAGTGTGAAAGSLGDGSQLSRLKQRMPSGVPLSEQDVMLPNIPFEELRLACNDFRRDGLLGHGGFGEVFRGKWNGQDVAVKRILEEKRLSVGNEAFQKCVNQTLTELHALHNYPAENVLPLLAFSFSESFATDPCLVYQYMPNGSVSDRLRRRQNTPPLSWERRANVALGTARGLRYLHANNIIHGDIKSGNILLDKHFEPKIGDFGLARGGPEHEDVSFRMVSAVRGTQVYLPDDYIRSHELTPAVDTFSFGIFMFELVSSRSPSFKEHQEPRRSVREIMLDAEQPPEAWVDNSVPPAAWSNILFYIGQDCAQRSRRARPAMKQVLEALDKLYQHPSSALALQVYYDEQAQRRQQQQQLQQQQQQTGRAEASGAVSADQNQPDDVPAVIDNIPAVINGSNVANVLGDIPAVIDDAGVPDLAALAAGSSKSSNVLDYDDDDDDDEDFSTPEATTSTAWDIDEPSLPNLSRHMKTAGQNPRVADPVNEQLIPDLSALAVAQAQAPPLWNSAAERLSAVEAAASNAASYDVLKSEKL